VKNELTQEEIGQRLVKLRKIKGLSQEDMAKSMDISRPSIAQIELGNRGLAVLELQKLSLILGFSIDDFLSPEFKIDEQKEDEKELKPGREQMRMAIPRFKERKFRNVLLYILERCAGKPNIGETALYKLLYFCDFNYYELYEEHLTGSKYRKLPYGPVPQRIDSIIAQMIEKGELQRVKTEYHGLPHTRYLPLKKADLEELKASEKTVVDQVLDQMGDWNASKISDYSHKDLPWEVTDEGKYISYEMAFYREMPYSVRVYDNED
jgi:transcriptional regulator with XRE-family HTH domain